MADKKEKKEKVDTGAEASKPTAPFKISKIIVSPAKKIGLKDYSSVTLSAGVEIVFDTPQDIDSNQVTEAFAQVREKLKAEMKEQFKALVSKSELNSK